VLREVGRLGGDEKLAPGQADAASLAHALHPAGMVGAIDAAPGLLSDASRLRALNGLLVRYRALPGDADDAEVASLAADVAAVPPRPEHPPPPVDLDAMYASFGDRLNRAPRRFMQQLRQVSTGTA
jgi:hypothetical protein